MQTLLYILLSNALVAAIPAVLALAAARWVRRPALTHALWLLALLKLLTPPIFDVNLRVLPAAAQAMRPAVSSQATPIAIASTANAPDSRFGVDPDADSPIDSIAEHQDAKVRPDIPWTSIVWAIWITGALVTLSLTVVRSAQFNRLLRLAQPASRIVQAQAKQVAMQLGIKQCPALYQVPGAVSPMLWAFASRPKLLLPAELWGRLSQIQQLSLLAHELAHYRRRDHWVRYLEMAAAIAYWWHPLVWLARRELRAAEEQCCDAWVVHALPGHERAYATALLDTVDFVSRSCGTTPPAACGAGGAKDLKRRLIMIMNAANPKSLSSLGRLAVLGLGLVLLPAVPKLASADGGGAPKGREERKDSKEGDRPRDGDKPAARPRGEGDRPRPEGDRPRGGDAAREERPQPPAETSGAGTFVRIERGALLLSDEEHDKDVRIAVRDGTIVTIDERPSNLRELRPGMVVKASTTDGVTTIQAKRPRWLKTLTPQQREGEPRRREGDGAAPRGEGDRPRGEGDRPAGDRPRAAEGDRPRDGDRPAVRGERPGVAEGARPLRGTFERLDGTSLVIGVGDTGGEKIVPTDGQTKVTIAGEPGKLGDLKPGMIVTVKQVEGLTTEVEARPGRRL